MQRICIYALDVYKNPFRFQIQLIKKAAKYFQKIIVVCNNETIDLKISSNIICCKGIAGFDVDKWKYAITQYYDEICKYDELVLLNDSFFGPIYEFSDIFQEMENKEIDFWGITDHKAIFRDEVCIANRFLQRYFMVFRCNVVSSKSFYDFWIGLRQMEAYQDTEQYFEFIFTESLSKLGFRYEVYCNTTEIEPTQKEYVTSHILFDTAVLLKKYHLPIVPTYIFCIDRATILNYATGTNCTEVLRYLEENRLYDVDIIYEYLLDTQNVYNLLNNLELTEIFPKPFNKKRLWCRKKTAIVIYLYYEDKFEEKIEKLRGLPKYMDIILITDSPLKKEVIQKQLKEQKIRATVLLHLIKGREWSALLLTAKEIIRKYDYFCFLHDKKSGYLAYKSVARDFENLLWDNLIESEEYVDSIIKYFEDHERVGLIVPPIANHGIYYRQFSDYWTICYEKTVELAERIGINVSKIEREYPPISIGSCFWCKTETFRNLFDFPFTENDFPDEPMEIDGTINHCLERIFPYIAQENGYFTVCAMTETHFKSRNTNNEYMLQQLNNLLSNKYEYCTFSELTNEMRYE